MKGPTPATELSAYALETFWLVVLIRPVERVVHVELADGRPGILFVPDEASAWSYLEGLSVAGESPA